MELLPVIYNSLIIAAGLFVITIAISYVSYRIKNKKEDGEAASDHLSNSRASVREGELKPKYKSPPPKPRKKESGEKRKEVPKDHKVSDKDRLRKSEKSKKDRRDDSQSRKVEKERDSRDRKTGSESRIEIVKDISKSSTQFTDEPARPKKEKTNIEEEKKKKKKLKSIDDDPLKKYTDSSKNDEFHPLKTDD